jgi:hypothetical protein
MSRASKRGPQGTSMGALETSAERRKREARNRRRQEKRWASKSQAVMTRRVEELTVEERARYGL